MQVNTADNVFAMDDENLILDLQNHNINYDTKRVSKDGEDIAKVLEVDDTEVIRQTTPPKSRGVEVGWVVRLDMQQRQQKLLGGHETDSPCKAGETHHRRTSVNPVSWQKCGQRFNGAGIGIIFKILKM